MAQNVKTVHDLAIASVKTLPDLAIASVKTIGDVDNTGGGGPSYLLDEGFEGSGSGGYENSWGESGSGSAIDPAHNTSPAPLVGSYSLCIDLVSDSAFAYFNFAPQGTLYGYFRFRIATRPSDGKRWLRLMSGTNGTGTAMQYLAVTSSLFYMEGVTSWPQQAIPADNAVDSTEYHVWFDYIKGTGSNGQGVLRFSTDGVKPTSGSKYAAYTGDGATSDVQSLAIGSENVSGFKLFFDEVRLSTTPLGDNGV